MSGKFPLQGWIGLGLVCLFWPLNWFLPGLRSHWAFFFLWAGYSLAVDGLVCKRTGTSLLVRSWRKYIGLFLASAPAWWLFELLNLRANNWVYLGVEGISRTTYFLLSTVAFSTVMPAVFATAELMASFPWFQKPRPGPVIKPNRGTKALFFLLGWGMLVLLLVWPKIFFPFMWTAVYFVIAPVNLWLGHRSLAENTQKGDWGPVLTLWAGVLVTAFFWEFWNFWSYPKWVYHLPYLDILHLFEMPIMGYFGYLPFSLELFALYHLFAGFYGSFRGLNKDPRYVKITSSSETPNS